MFAALKEAMTGTTTTQSAPNPGEHARLVAEQLADEQRLAVRVAHGRWTITDLEAHAAALRAQLDTVYAQRNEAEHTLRQETFAYDTRCADREKRLREIADTRIHAFLDWIDRERDALPAKVVRGEIRGGIDASTGRRVPPADTSNITAIRVIATALVRVREQAEALKFTTVRDLDQALAALKQSIPTLEQAEVLAREES